ncbi:MAG TPA: isocitrate lyase/phosphoenolpyruvate mutase family protein [Candidatus Binataceae bacterium]
MDLEAQFKRAEAFRRMHGRGRILLLPNAWDAMSARIFEAAGFEAIATTSAGVAYAIGYPDGELVPRDEMIAAVARIARVVDIPVTADMESGFAQSPAEVAETVKLVISAGALGINLEDTVHGAGRTLYEIPDAVERVRSARAAATAAGVPIVINARTDVYLLGIGEKAARFDHAVSRLNAYRAAGADCLYAMGYFDADTIGRLTKAVNGPLNVMGLPGTPPVAELERLGVARVSTASGPARVAMTATRDSAVELLRSGSFEVFGGKTMSHQEANALMDKRRA